MGEWEVELLAFPKGRHDDQADVFAQAALDATSEPLVDRNDLAPAVDDAELTHPAPGPH